MFKIKITLNLLVFKISTKVYNNIIIILEYQISVRRDWVLRLCVLDTLYFRNKVDYNNNKKIYNSINDKLRRFVYLLYYTMIHSHVIYINLLLLFLKYY